MAVLVPPVIWSGYQGETITLALLYKNVNGNLADATEPSVTLYCEGTGTSLHFTLSDMTHESTGTYHLSFSLSDTGDWWGYMFDGAVKLGPSSPFILVVSPSQAYGR